MLPYWSLVVWIYSNDKIWLREEFGARDNFVTEHKDFSSIIEKELKMHACLLHIMSQNRGKYQLIYQTTWSTLWLQPRCACTSLGACQTSHNRRWYSTLGSTVYLALSSHSQPAQTSPRKTCDLWRDPCFSLPALRQQEHRYPPWSQSWKYKNKWSIQENLNENHHLTCCLEQAMLRHFS